MQYVIAPLMTVALFSICFLFSVFLKLSLPERKREKRKSRRIERREKVYFVADLKPVSAARFNVAAPEREKVYEKQTSQSDR